MPAVNGNPDDHFYGLMVDFARRLTALEAIASNVGTVYSGQLLSTVSASGSSFQDLGFPSVAVVVPASGKLKVTVNSFILVPNIAGAQSGAVSVGIDGNNPTGVLRGVCAMADNGASGPQGSCAATVIVSGIAPGNHNLKCVYQAASTASFQNTFLQAEPA